jgi:hypothetical protein
MEIWLHWSAPHAAAVAYAFGVISANKVLVGKPEGREETNLKTLA